MKQQTTQPLILFRGTDNLNEIRHLMTTGQVHGKLMDADPLKLSDEDLTKQSTEQIGLNERIGSHARGVPTVFTSYTTNQNWATSFGKGDCIAIAVDPNKIHIYNDEKDIIENRANHKDKYPLVKGQDSEILVPNNMLILDLAIIVKGQMLQLAEIEKHLQKLDEAYESRTNSQAVMATELRMRKQQPHGKHSEKVIEQKTNAAITTRDV